MDPEGHSFVRTLWAFWFVIEDEEGSQLKLSVYDEHVSFWTPFDIGALVYLLLSV